jgi:8-oxo-dGTP pyrophosphatase MutT (NUDIX family)
MNHRLVFDPRQVPWTLQAGHWPHIQQENLTADRLRAVFQNPPVWAPELKREPQMSLKEPAAAAVLVPIVLRGPQGQHPHVLLTQRTQHLSSHPGQIAFPGGKVDAEDASIEHAALREAQEEVGLLPQHVQVIGTLPTYITGTAFHITPVVGLVSPEMSITPNPFEVDEVFEVPLEFLMNPVNHHFHELEREGVLRRWYSMPYLEPLANTPHPSSDSSSESTSGLSNERFIWGATAGMIRNLYRFLLASNSL